MSTNKHTFIPAAAPLFAALFAVPLLLSSAPAMAQGTAAHQPKVAATTLPGPSDELLTKLERIYKDIHANPELSMEEQRTAGIAAEWLRQHGYEVTEGVGKTGVVGLLRNGEGPTVLMRADMDALPMQENTGLPYASRKTGIDPSSGRETGNAHSCGHDMHVAWLMGAAQVLAANKDKWRGTVMVVFQPGEETGMGARAMLDDGLAKRFPKPDIALAQHVLPLPAGNIAIRNGLVLSQSDSLRVTLYGRGGHGSSPQTTVDPVVMAAATIMRLQTVVSRELGLTDNAVLSVGSVQAGSSANIIPDEAVLQLNIRTFDDEVREQVLAAIKRVVEGEARTAGAPKPPVITRLPGEFPLTVNDEEATRKVTAALQQRFGSERVGSTGPASASEDFSLLPRAWGIPSVYWIVGGVDPQQYAEAKKTGNLNALPSNHSPEFAPVPNPTLRAGVEAMLAAASVWLVPADSR